MNRTRLAEKNIIFGYAGTLATAAMGFILKQVFITRLGDTLNGVNGLYTNILSMLNIAELGIGTALNFALYGPVARGETSKITSYMRFYRRAYHLIGLVIAAAGLLLLPFLQYFVRSPGSVTLFDLRAYYLIFLFNTVSSYFVSYKYSLVNAEQKNYVQTNIYSVTKLVSGLVQLAVLLITGSFYAYLLSDAAVQLLQKAFVSVYLDRRYPYLKEKDAAPLAPEEYRQVWTKTRALIWLKLGDVARLQTDSLIISSFIAVSVSGMVDNYNMVINSVGNFAHIIFNSVISGFGNLVATESAEKQRQMFGVYRFFAAWVYGFIAAVFFALLSPFVGQLWLTPKHILPALSVNLILVDFYLKGERIVLSNFKTAAGVFEPDKYLPALQGLVNLVISIALVIRIGLPGVYIGTVVSGIMANIVKPWVIYRTCFKETPSRYYAGTVKYAAANLALALLVRAVTAPIAAELTWVRFIAAGLLAALIYNGAFIAMFGRSWEFREIYVRVKDRLPNFRSGRKG